MNRPPAWPRVHPLPPAKSLPWAALATAAVAAVAIGALPSPAPAQPGAWEFGPPMPHANSEFTAATIGSEIFTVGAYEHDHSHDVFAFHPASGAWREAAALPDGVHHVVAVVVGTRLLVFGGGGAASSATQIYDPAADAWTLGAPMPTPRTAAATAVIGGRVHVIGGSDSINRGVAKAAHEIYDPVTDSWSAAAPLPVASEHVFAGVLAGRIVVVGGRDNLVNIDRTQVYDPATDTWSPGAPLPVATSGMAAQAFRGRLYVFGGEDIFGASVTAAVQRYDLATDTWERLEDMPIAVHGVASAVHGDAIHLFGGSRTAASGVGIDTVQVLRFPPLPAPKKPTGARAKADGAGAVVLTWKDNSSGETGFAVEMRPPGSKTFRAVAELAENTRSVRLVGLAPGVTRFRVIALAGSSRSAPSNVAAVRVSG